jgi:uncharacterized protein
VYFSKYNLNVGLVKYPDYFIMHNLFHGQASLLSREFFDRVQYAMAQQSGTVLAADELRLLKDKRFLYDSEQEEQALIRNLYGSFSDALLTSNPTRQYQILLTYDCNLCCRYCFQKRVRSKAVMTPVQLETVLSLIAEIEGEHSTEARERNLHTQVPLLSIVGGEPLLDNDQCRSLISTIILFARSHGFSYAFTTNGVNLERFLNLFAKADYFPRDVQVTVDGTKEIHDRRRPKRDRGGSFDDIIAGVEAALRASMHVSLRVNVDAQNINSIEGLAAVIIAREWHTKPHFYAYLAPVTDHSGVNGNYGWISTGGSMIERIVEKLEQRPELFAIYQLKNFRGFTCVRNIVEKRGLPVPTFFRCEAVLGQLIFDPFGNLYSCFEGAGNPQARIGSYNPEYRLDAARVSAWRGLNSFSSRPCGECRFRFVCAGGCPWHIIHRGETECLPIELEVKLAWNYFADRVVEDLKAAS